MLFNRQCYACVGIQTIFNYFICPHLLGTCVSILHRKKCVPTDGNVFFLSELWSPLLLCKKFACFWRMTKFIVCSKRMTSTTCLHFPTFLPWMHHTLWHESHFSSSFIPRWKKFFFFLSRLHNFSSHASLNLHTISTRSIQEQQIIKSRTRIITSCRYINVTRGKTMHITQVTTRKNTRKKNTNFLWRNAIKTCVNSIWCEYMEIVLWMSSPSSSGY